MGYLFAVITVLLINPVVFAQGVLINEYMTGNLAAIADEDGRYPDWFELYNNSFDPVSLNGWTICDHPSDTLPWPIPNFELSAFQRVLFFASAKNKGQLAPFNETVIRPGDPCRYLVPASEPAFGWYWPDINDSDWQRGRLSLGYGDGDDSTIVPATTSLYIRIDFNVDNVSDLEYAILHADYDDGFVAYVNGEEVARANVGGLPPRFDSTSVDEHEAVMWAGGRPELFFVPTIGALVRQGRNVLAIQVHNSDPASDDLSIIPFFTLGLKRQPVVTRDPVEALRGFLLQMHTDFKLAGENDTLILRRGDGTVVDEVIVQDVPSNMSRGRAPDGSNDWRIFQIPTPGEPNPLVGGTVVTPKPLMSPLPGFYTTPITVTIRDTITQANIYYTLDGSTPDESSIFYTGPFVLDTSCVVRAVARIPGELLSPDRVRSYIIGPRPTLPVISLSMKPDDLWNPETGMYVLGPTYDPLPPFRGANFWQNWERPVHVEMFETNGLEAFEVDAGLKIHGGWTRSFPQKSLRIMARAKYGDPNIAYRVFPDWSFDKFESLVLRNGGSDWDHAIFRDDLLTGLMREDFPYISAYRPAIIYLNGAYWGILNIRQQMNEQFVAERRNVDPSEVDEFEIWGEKVNGEWDAYTELVEFFNTRDLSLADNYRIAEEMVDIDEFIKYNAVNIYVDNGDWPGNNNRLFRIRRPGEKWHWFLLDLDFGFGLHADSSWVHNSLADALDPDGPVWPNPPYATLYLRKLCENPIFRAKFINGFANLMNFQFKPDNVLRHMNEKKATIQGEVERHLVRWDRNLAEWEEKVATIPPFAHNRPAAMRQFLEERFNLPGHASITLSCNPPVGGDIKINGRNIIPTGWSGIYFRTVPIVLDAVPLPGYRFIGWTGGSASTDSRITITLDNDRSLTAIFALAPGLVGLPVINEINYHSLDSFDTGDWVELYALDGEVNLSDWSLSDQDSTHHYVFPIGTTIPSGQYLVVAEDTMKFHRFFPGMNNVLGNMGFGLDGNGDQVRLLSSRLETIDSVRFNDIPPWPGEADGLGATLELIDPALRNEDSTNWRASLVRNGSPMASNRYNQPGQFQLLSPPDGASVRNDSVLVRWSKSVDNDPGDTVRYVIEWSRTGNFPASSAPTLDTFTYITDVPANLARVSHVTDGLPEGMTIFWRVRAMDTRNFTTIAAPGDSGWSFTINLPVLPTEFGLRPVFPNPFNSRVTVTVDVAVAGEVSLAFYNLLGQVVYANRSVMQAGSHKFFFPSVGEDHMASGIYWVRVSQADKSAIAKLVLVR